MDLIDITPIRINQAYNHAIATNKNAVPLMRVIRVPITLHKVLETCVLNFMNSKNIETVNLNKKLGLDKIRVCSDYEISYQEVVCIGAFVACGFLVGFNPDQDHFSTQCNICKQISAYDDLHIAHMKVAHAQDAEKPKHVSVPCTLCGRILSSYQIMIRHYRRVHSITQVTNRMKAEHILAVIMNAHAALHFQAKQN